MITRKWGQRSLIFDQCNSLFLNPREHLNQIWPHSLKASLRYCVLKNRRPPSVSSLTFDQSNLISSSKSEVENYIFFPELSWMGPDGERQPEKKLLAICCHGGITKLYHGQLCGIKFWVLVKKSPPTNDYAVFVASVGRDTADTQFRAWEPWVGEESGQGKWLTSIQSNIREFAERTLEIHSPTLFNSWAGGSSFWPQVQMSLSKTMQPRVNIPQLEKLYTL